MKTRKDRINAGWLRLWRTVYPNTPPPVEGRTQKTEVRVPNPEASRHKPDDRSPEDRRSAADDYLNSLLCAWLALALLLTGCVGPRPLKGGRAVTTRKPAGVIEQTLVQSQNPAEATKQTQETVKVRT